MERVGAGLNSKGFDSPRDSAELSRNGRRDSFEFTQRFYRRGGLVEGGALFHKLCADPIEHDFGGEILPSTEFRLKDASGGSVTVRPRACGSRRQEDKCLRRSQEALPRRDQS